MSPKPPAPLPARALQLGRSILRDLGQRSAFEGAAAVAFWFFLSLVPLLVLVGYLVGQVAREHGVDELVGPLLEIIPGSAESLVRTELDRLAHGGGASLAPVGMVGFLWTASSGLHNLMEVIEKGAHVAGRPWWKKRAIALAWVVAGLTAACILAWLLVNIDSMLQAHEAPVRAAARGHGAFQRRFHKALHARREQALAATLLLASGMAMLAAFYRFAVEHPPGVRRRVWPGTVAAVLSWLLVSWVFGAYVGTMADYALYYGSLAAVAVLLVWLYLTGLSLVAGAEVNLQLEAMGRSGLRARAAPRAAPPKGGASVPTP